MNEGKIKYFSGRKPAMNQAFETSTSDPRGIVVNNNTIETDFTMEIRIASQNVFYLRPIDF
jgi:hypothetical protein